MNEQMYVMKVTIVKRYILDLSICRVYCTDECESVANEIWRELGKCTTSPYFEYHWTQKYVKIN